MLGLGNQYRTKDASAVAVFLADLEIGARIDRIEQLERESCKDLNGVPIRDANYLNVMPIASSFLAGEGHAALWAKQTATTLLSTVQPMPTIEPIQSWSSKNVALLAQSFVLGLTSHGLATCIMEGLDDRRVKDTLRIPDRYSIPLVVATGYEYDYYDEEKADGRDSRETPRLPLNEVVFEDTFGDPMTDWSTRFFPQLEEEKEESEVNVPPTHAAKTN